MDELATPALAAAMRRIIGNTAQIVGLVRLSGGANMESWSFDYDSVGYVLRRASSMDMMANRPFGHAVEAAVIRAACAAGVRAPEIVGELIASDDLGSGYLMRRVEAKVNPAEIYREASPTLLTEMAQELAKIHAMPLSNLPPELPHATPAMLVDELRMGFKAAGGDRPVMALALRWLQDHLPAPAPPVFLHGDYRLGNVMVSQQGLAAVLDWELAHIGDRHQDLAYGCINSWRFGQIDKPAFGLGDLNAYWAAYSTASGVAVEPARFRFWLVYACLWWGLTCLHMADIWRQGQDRSLERAVIGRRTSETEVDLLILLEEDAPLKERERLEWTPAQAPAAGGEPSAVELIDAVSAWIAQEVKPRAQGRDKFLAAVALNALGMLTRDVAHPVVVANSALSQALLEGGKSLATPGLLKALKRQALAKLAVDQPRYSALTRAMDLWTDP